MYTMYEGNVCISVQDWYDAGLTNDQFKKDSKNGLLKIARRGIGNTTLIVYNSIVRSERKKMIENVIGSVADFDSQENVSPVAVNAKDAEFFRQQNVSEQKIPSLLTSVSMFRTIAQMLADANNVRARLGSRVKLKDFWANTTKWQIQQCANADGKFYGVSCYYKNSRSLQRAFESFQNDGLNFFIPKNLNNDHAKKTSHDIDNLIISLWRTHDKPFVSQVYKIYHDFLDSKIELFDRETGEIFQPENFNAKPVSNSTIWRILHQNQNYTAIYSDRNGHFDYQNSLRPKHHRAHGMYSLSKISMDDVALSRKSAKGWAYKYIAVDVVSGYYFRPAYVVGKPSINTVLESFRFMFIELMELNLKMPMELEVEHHLMSQIPWLNDLFPFIRFCNSPTEKRAEHNIKSLKWGTAKANCHTRGRWYAKHEAYRSIRNKVDGDYTEPEHDLNAVIMDDIRDIEKHNNELHPDQKTYPGLTRRDVLIKYANPNAQDIATEKIIRYLGNETHTSIRNNDYIRCANGEYQIEDFDCLDSLTPGSNKVTAYWLPNEDGSVDNVYLYQEDKYIGIATNRNNYSYNECQAERTDEDEAKMLAQNKRVAKFDKKQRERRAEIPQIGISDNSLITEASSSEEQPLIIEENPQPKNYEQDEFNSPDSDDLSDLALDLM